MYTKINASKKIKLIFLTFFFIFSTTNFIVGYAAETSHKTHKATKTTSKHEIKTKKTHLSKVTHSQKKPTSKKTPTLVKNNQVKPLPLKPLQPVKIHVLRPSAFWGNIMTAPIYINDHFVGRVGNGGYLTWVGHPGIITVATTPGRGVLKFQNNGPNAIRFVAKEGNSYDVMVSVPYQLNVFGTAFELQLVNDKA